MIYRIILLFFVLTILCNNAKGQNRDSLLKEWKSDEVLKPYTTWVFILAGQSNMAGRGKISGIDTIPNRDNIKLNC